MEMGRLTRDGTADSVSRDQILRHERGQGNLEMSRLTRDGTADSVSRDQILRHERGQGNFHFSCSADHVQDWQPYPVCCCCCFLHINRSGLNHTQ